MILNDMKFGHAILVTTSLITASSSAFGEQFSVIALPDTQFYSRYQDTAQYLDFQNPFYTQTQWISDNASSRNIRFTAHLGDLVDQAEFPVQWQLADQAMQTLDNSGLNYGVARGNHDVLPLSAANTPPKPFTDYFGPTRFQSMASYRGSDTDGVNSYHQFEGGGRTFGVLFTDWRNDSEALAWSQSVLDDNPDIPTILISHQIIAPNVSDPNTPNDTSHGELLWDELINENDQVFMTINGHHQGTAWRVEENAYGRDVLQMVVDYQFSPFNGTGYLRELVFDTDTNTISATTFSPWVEAAEDAGVVIPGFFNVTQEIDTPQAQFVYSVDFDDRFTPVPEPTSLALLGLGGLLIKRRRRL